MNKILTIIGTRPQFIKAAIISRVIKQKYKQYLNEVIVHTGQHYDNNMSDIFFDEMNIPKPDYYLDIKKNASHGEMTGEIMIKLEQLIKKETPDMVLVYGDTNSTLAGALTASKLNIPVAHIEAGLRSYNRQMPEEINRIVTDHVSQILFPPTDLSKKQLAKEGVIDNVFVVGDVMYDAALFYKKYAVKPAAIKDLPQTFYLATCHRQENTDNKQNLVNIFNALKILSREIPVIIPLHPRTKKYVNEYEISTDGVCIIEPIGYLEMLYLLEHAKMVLTDSGGFQKEAYYFSRPVVIMRNETEWVELVDNGVGQIAGADTNKIVQVVKYLANINFFPANLYGDGKAGEKIVEIIYDKLS